MSYPLTDVGNGDRFLAHCRDKEISYEGRYWRRKLPVADQFGGPQYRSVSEDELLKMAIEVVRAIPVEFYPNTLVADIGVEVFMRKSESLARLKAMIRLAEVLSRDGVAQ